MTSQPPDRQRGSSFLSDPELHILTWNWALELEMLTASNGGCSKASDFCLKPGGSPFPMGLRRVSLVRLATGQLGEVASYQYGGCFLDAMGEHRMCSLTAKIFHEQWPESWGIVRVRIHYRPRRPMWGGSPPHMPASSWEMGSVSQAFISLLSKCDSKLGT